MSKNVSYERYLKRGRKFLEDLVAERRGANEFCGVGVDDINADLLEGAFDPPANKSSDSALALLPVDKCISEDSGPAAATGIRGAPVDHCGMDGSEGDCARHEERDTATECPALSDKSCPRCQPHPSSRCSKHTPVTSMTHGGHGSSVNHRDAATLRNSAYEKF
ncbi:hypothetical protein Hypma_001151 [Hypsizygus marmoreus]|uniref:Uncharacterized protein n=1 Tax=Hypsizygus marmoreus TaxID=39966 RepID=A0A369J6P4_HYPMA|nr:hypothetical protein Hypma_001151 [Hypsizygus marmoreus]